MSETVAQILGRLGPCLSSEIVLELVKVGSTPEAARQRVSRAKLPVKRLRGVGFPNRERFLFLEDQFNTPRYRESLSAALERSGSAFGRALHGLRIRGGSMPSWQFPIASGLPVSNAKGQLLHSLVVEKLRELGLITDPSRLIENREERSVRWLSSTTHSCASPWAVHLGIV